MNMYPLSKSNTYEQQTAVLLLQDGLRKYWVLIFPAIFFFICSIPAGNFGSSFHGWVFVMGPLLLAWETERGVEKVYKTLPVAPDVHATIRWLKAVIVFPLLYMLFGGAIVLFVVHFLALSLGALHNGLMAIFFTAIIGMGYASLAVLLLSSGQVLKRNRGLSYSGWLICCIIGATVPFMPRWPASGLQQPEGWRIVLLGASMVLVVWSYLHREHFIGMGR